MSDLSVFNRLSNNFEKNKAKGVTNFEVHR